MLARLIKGYLGCAFAMSVALILSIVMIRIAPFHAMMIVVTLAEAMMEKTSLSRFINTQAYHRQRFVKQHAYVDGCEL